MKGERLVGGLWCHEVLARLSDYLDGELEMSERDEVDAHLRVCDICERFGGDFAHAIKKIRVALITPPPLAHDLEERLQRAILESD